MKRLFVMLMVLAAPVFAAPPANLPLTIDSQVLKQPKVTVFRNNDRVIGLTFKDGGTATDLTGATIQFSYSANANAGTVVTAAVAIVSAAAGTATASFTASALNQSAASYVYEALVTDSGGSVATFAQGKLVIRPSPAATGTNITSGLNSLNWSAIDTYNGTWPISGGTNIVVASSTTGLVINSTASSVDTLFTNFVNVGGIATITGGTRSGSNVITVTAAAVTNAIRTEAGYAIPSADGSAGQVVRTDGAGVLSFASRRFNWGGNDPAPTNGGTLRFIQSEIQAEKIDLRWMGTAMQTGSLGFTLGSQFWTNSIDNYTVLADINATTTAASNNLEGITITNLYRIVIAQTNATPTSTNFSFSVQGDVNP